MSKQDNIYNLAGQYNSRLHISNFIEPLIEPLKKKYGVKVDELSILWDQVFEDDEDWFSEEGSDIKDQLRDQVLAVVAK